MLRDDLYKTWHKSTEIWGVEILTGDYQGLVVHIKELDLKEDTNELTVDYNILYKPDVIDQADVENTSEKFSAFFNLVINDIVQEAISIYEQRDQAGNNNPQELS